MTDPRVYIPFDNECNYCTNPAVWTVFSNSHSDLNMQVCDEHKTTAFS